MNVFLIAAITVDGFIAEQTDQISTSWTSKEDKQFFSERTKQAGVIVMGSSTYKTIGRPLPGRLNIVYSSKMPKQQDVPQLRYTQLPPKELIASLAKECFKEVAICGGASIYKMFLEAGAINKLYLTVEPVVFGAGVKLFGDDLSARVSLKLVKMEHLSDQTLLLEYDVS